MQWDVIWAFLCKPFQLSEYVSPHVRAVSTSMRTSAKKLMKGDTKSYTIFSNLIIPIPIQMVALETVAHSTADIYVSMASRWRHVIASLRVTAPVLSGLICETINLTSTGQLKYIPEITLRWICIRHSRTPMISPHYETRSQLRPSGTQNWLSF